MNVLKTQNLIKRYGSINAVDGISLSVEQGDIFGLIGQNGAGKTTLMRMVASLTVPTGGSIELFGKSDKAGLNAGRKRMGCMVETPVLYPNMTASQNLEYYRIQRGIPDKTIIEKSLKTVNLTDTGKLAFGHFSLGMKQRLGLALSILGSPDFIMLDEPINGLDPMGIIEVRDLIKRFNEQGITVLISSHILTELAQVATKYAIIHKGRLVKTITNSQLQEECKLALSVTVDDIAKATALLEETMNMRSFKHIGKNELRIYEFLDKPDEVTFKLVSGGIRVFAIQAAGDTLEEYFKNTIGGGAK